jgi:tetratricopeptide (TPR) repeat protein
MNITERIEQIRKEYPKIRPFEEEDDIEWWNEGLDQIEAGKLDQAEETFKKLILAQPDHSDGFNGLGLVYAKKADKQAAEAFLREAIAKAQIAVSKGDMDPWCLSKIKEDLNQLLGQSS